MFFSLQKKQKLEFSDQYMDVGFSFYLILARMVDVDPKVAESCKYTKGRKEMFYLTTHSTHFIYCYMASDIW